MNGFLNPHLRGLLFERGDKVFDLAPFVSGAESAAAVPSKEEQKNHSYAFVPSPL